MFWSRKTSLDVGNSPLSALTVSRHGLHQGIMSIIVGLCFVLSTLSNKIELKTRWFLLKRMPKSFVVVETGYDITKSGN